MKPFPFQERNVELMLRDPRKRWVLDETGLGKSVTAILAAKSFGAHRVLIVTKGMVRPGWLERLREWWPERAEEVGSITMGKDRKGLSKPAQARLEASYAAPIQVVSYDLLRHCSPWQWDMIVLDEIHELVSYRSATSKLVRNFFRCSSQAVKLGLTATLLSAEPKHTWNLLHMWEPGRWGHAQESGEPPWWFQRRYGVRWENDYGVVYRGLNEEYAAEFAEKLAEVSMRTLRSDVADLLPPIDCAPLLIEASNKGSDLALAIDWLKTALAESDHVSVFTYFRDSAAALASELQQLPRFAGTRVQVITGEHSPEARHKMLAELRDSQKGVLVGTVDALGTGITLTAFKQYLITEATTTANKLVQVIGRFSRLDSKEPCRGFVLLREGRDDDTIATLRRRLGDFNALIKSGQGEQALLSVLEQPLQGDAFDRRLDDLIANFRGVGAIEDDEDDAA